MDLLLLGAASWLLGGGLALLISRVPRVANLVGAVGLATGSVISLIVPMTVLVTSQAAQLASLPWSVPGGRWELVADPLSAWFAVPVFGCSLVIVLFMGGWIARRETLLSKAGPIWAATAVMFVGMSLVLFARNVLLWLFGWELMSLALYFLVISEGTVTAAAAGRIYLIATQLATAALMPALLLLAGNGEVWTLAAVPTGSVSEAVTGTVFVLAALGFGAKAGLLPVHVWMPATYQAAPPFVPALSSGLMSKVAIYGFVRVMLLLGKPPLWWAVFLIGLGIVSSLGGILFALPQRQLRRTLAYSSSENMGILYLGLGVGVLGLSLEAPAAAMLGFAGTLLHVWNHALMKTLLFLGTGVVEDATGTSQLDHLGGLMKRMPAASCLFGVGAAAISGIPPLNGFIGEFFIFLGAFEEEVLSGNVGTVPALGVIGILALVGGLAVMNFTQVFGIVFLGEPRSAAAARAQRTPFVFLFPMLFLAAGCITVALAAPTVLAHMLPALTQIGSASPEMSLDAVQKAMVPLSAIHQVFVSVLLLMVAFAVLRGLLLAGRTVGTTGTWDCGYAQPTARMQYTATSYGEAIASFLPWLIPSRTELSRPQGLFAGPSALWAAVSEPFQERFFRPVMEWLGSLMEQAHAVQHGRLNYYVLSIALTMLALLGWYAGRLP